MSSMSFPDQKECYSSYEHQASKVDFDPNGTAAAGTGPSAGVKISTAAASQLKVLSESFEKNMVVIHSPTPSAAGVSPLLTPLLQIPANHALGKAMQMLAVLFSDNLLGAFNPIKLDQLYGLHLGQIIDISWNTLVLAIYQQTPLDKRNQKSLLSTLSETDDQSLELMRSCRIQKALIFCKISITNLSVKKTFEDIIEALNQLNKFPQFYHTPYLILPESLTAFRSIITYVQEISDRMTQLMIPNMEVLLLALQKCKTILSESTKKIVDQNLLKRVAIKNVVSTRDEQRNGLVRFNQRLIYLLVKSLKFLKIKENSKHLDVEDNDAVWTVACKNLNSTLFLFREYLKYDIHLGAFGSGCFIIESARLFCEQVLTASITNRIIFYQSLIEKLIKFKASASPEFNLAVQADKANYVTALCLYAFGLKNPCQNPAAREKILIAKEMLESIRLKYSKEVVNSFDELKEIVDKCADEFMKHTFQLFDKKNLFAISSNQNILMPDEKLLYESRKFIELNHSHIIADFEEFINVLVGIYRDKNKNVAEITTELDFLIAKIHTKMENLKFMKSEKSEAKFAKHLESFTRINLALADSSDTVLLIKETNSVLPLLKPVVEVIMPIIDMNRKAMARLKESSTQSVDYWLDSIVDSRFNEVDPLEAIEKAESLEKELPSKKNKKFKGNKKALAAIESPGITTSASALKVIATPKRTLGYISHSSNQFAAMRCQLSAYHHLPNHVVVPNALVGQHVAISNVAIQQQIYPAESLQAVLEILESSQNIQDQRLAILSFFLYGHLFLEQSLIGPYLSQFPNKEVTHRLSILLKDLGLKACEKWMEVNPWDTRSFRYPHACLQNYRGNNIPLALWHATQSNDSSTKEAQAILDQLVQEAIILQQILQKQSGSKVSNDFAVVGKGSKKAVEADVKESSAADPKKMIGLGLMIDKVLRLLTDVVKKMPEFTFEQKKIKSTLKDVEFHLRNLHDLVGLVMRHSEQRFLFLHANIAMLSTQYLAENLGAYLSLLSGDSMRDHDLMAYHYHVYLGSHLNESDMTTFQAINVRKGSEYIFQYFNNRHLSEISPQMHYLNGLYATSSMALKEREGIVIEKSSSLSLTEMHKEFYKFLEPLVALAINLVNHHVLENSVK